MLKKSLPLLLCLSLSVSSVSAAELTANQAVTTQAQTQAPAGEYKPFKSAVLQEEAERASVTKIPVGNAYIPAGTELTIELTSTVSSKTLKKGDPLPLKTLDNIIINDVIVIPAGTPVEGVVTKATKSGMFGRSGKLEFTITSVKTINNVQIPLEYTAFKKAGHDGGAIAVAAVVSFVGGMFMKGKNVEFPAGSHFQAKVVSDTDLLVKLSDLAVAMDPNKPHGVAIMLK